MSKHPPKSLANFAHALDELYARGSSEVRQSALRGWSVTRD